MLGYTQLPNGDLWKGVDINAVPRLDTVDETPAPTTPDDVVAEMLKQKGELMTCAHCGMQFNRKQLNELREHIETLHKSAITPITGEQALAADAMFGKKPK